MPDHRIGQALAERGAGCLYSLHGDAQTGAAKNEAGAIELVQFPVLLPMEAPLIRAYPKEGAIAEKLHAMVVLDMANSRMKDFHDIWFLSKRWPFNLGALRSAINSTFERRSTPVPEQIPTALSAAFLTAPEKQAQWRAFRTRLGDHAPSLTLEEVGKAIRDFIAPTLSRDQNLPPQSIWSPGKGWNEQLPSVEPSKRVQ